MSNIASGRMATDNGEVVNVADAIGGVDMGLVRDVNTYAPRSGRMLDEEGNTVNIADAVGGVPVGRIANIEKYAPSSGNLIKEDGTVVNIAKALVERLNGGGGTTEGISLGYTLNKDGTYVSKSASKDSEFPSGEWYAKFVYVSDKTYTTEELIGHTIRLKEIHAPTGVTNNVSDIKVTEDMFLTMGNGAFAIIDSNSGLPILAVITEGMTGIDISGDGFVLPSNAGTYLVYADKNPDKQGSVLGSVSVKKSLGKPYIDTSGITDFSYFFANDARKNIINNIDTSNGINFNNMFYNCFSVNSIPRIDTSNGTNFKSMFEKCYAITTIPQLDTSKGTNFDSMFYQSYAITTIPQLDTSSGTSFATTFNGCSSVKSIAITTAKKDFQTSSFGGCTLLENLTIGEGWAVSIYVHYSNNLTVESLHGMIENLADLTGKTAKKFQIGATNLAKIDEAHINMLNTKNWEYS